MTQVVKIALLFLLMAASGTASTAPGVKLPELQRFVAPNCSRVASSTDERHTAALIVNEDGTVREVTITNVPGTALSNEVVQTMRKWVFLPALKGGQPISVRILIPFSYESATGEVTFDLAHYMGD